MLTDLIKRPGMNSVCRRMLVAFILTFLVLPARPLRAQETAINLTSWNVEVWPEYDRPSVLVISNGTVAEGTLFPQTLTIPLPEGAIVNAVADVDTSGGLFSLEWSSRDTPAGQEVIFEIDKPQFVVEYYLDVISPPPSRSFDLSLIAPYAAQQGSISLRQPARASAIQIEPAMAQTGIDSLNNPMYSQQLGPLVAGQGIPLRVSYTKPDAEPSVAATGEPSSADQPTQTAESQSSGTTAWLPWLVGGLLAVLLGAVAVYLALQWRQSHATKSRQARRKEARDRAAPVQRSGPSSEGKGVVQNTFCPRCGNRYGDSDKFCRNCGTARQ